LHLPHETRTALELFRDFETPEFGVNGFYTSADFRELANRFKIPSSQSNKIIEEFRSKQEKVKHMIQRSFLSEPAKERYREVIADRMRALKM
ncbi:MAG: type II toxin-antitoxin system HipA family toxin, partial [Chthoniobacterales bacterium]